MGFCGKVVRRRENRLWKNGTKDFVGCRRKDENIEKPVRRYNASNNTNISKNLNNNSRKGGNR